MNPIQALLNEKKYILADGGMGTMLFAAGLQHGDPPEKWNLEHPDRVAAVHRAYLEAGAQLLLKCIDGIRCGANEWSSQSVSHNLFKVPVGARRKFLLR